jgi:hypothetical protein
MAIKNIPIKETAVQGKYVVYYLDGRKRKGKSHAMSKTDAIAFMEDISRTIKQPPNYPIAGTDTPGGYEKFTLNQLKAKN